MTKTTEKTIKQLVNIMDYDLQAGLLSVRDDEVTKTKMPEEIYTTLAELNLIKTTDNENDFLELSDFGAEVVNFCSC